MERAVHARHRQPIQIILISVVRFTFMLLETIDKYLSKLKVTGLQPESNVYRGQSNSEWSLESSATRHLSVSPDTRFANDLVSYHKDILVKARRGVFDVQYDGELPDLQLLAELQHFGEPTGLLDFTWNPLVAMWFASLDNSKDGKLFAINTNNPGNVYRIFGDGEKQDISKILFYPFSTETPPVSIWEPSLRSAARNRILVQSSVFVIGPPEFTKYGGIVSEITIEKEDKKELLSELSRLYINGQSLRTDIVSRRITEHSAKNDYIDNSKFIRGITFLQQREFDSAGYIFDSLIESDSDKAEYYLYRGIVNVYLKNYKKTAEDLDRYILLVDSNINHSAYNFRSIANHELGHFDLAIEDCDNAIKMQPDNVMAYFNRGVSMAWLSQYKKMLSDNDKVIRLAPYFFEPYYNRAVANYKLGRCDDAIEDLEKVIQFDAEYSAAYHVRASAYYELGKYEDAVQDFTRAIELDPEAAEAFLGRASTYYELEKYEDAVQDCTRAIELDPEYATAFSGRANAYDQLGRYEDAGQDCTRAIELDPEYAEAFLGRAVAYYELEKYEDAVQDCTRAIELDPEYAEAFLIRAGAYYELEKYEDAVQDCTRTIELDPEYAEAYLGRANANKALGHIESYEKDLEIAYQLKPQLAK